MLGFVSGFLGISLGLFVYLSMLCSINSFGVPFLSPYAPASNSKGNGYLIPPIWKRQYRAPFISPQKQHDQEKISMKWKYKSNLKNKSES